MTVQQGDDDDIQDHLKSTENNKCDANKWFKARKLFSISTNKIFKDVTSP